MSANVESQARRASALASALAPILPFLEDDSIVEIMLNADGSVWVDQLRVGMSCTSARMTPYEAETMLRFIASETNVELNAANPSLAAKLPLWGTRVQASIPPVVEAPVFSMRKPARVVFSLEDYVRCGVLSPNQHEALLEAIASHANILIGGGTGCGKTTFANALLKVIAERTEDRVLIIEDTPELQCEARNKIQVLVQAPVYTWQRAVMDAMRYRPDRILVGEVRDGSALELLKAWNTGHPGGMATIHANGTAAMLDRICQLIEEVVYPAPRLLVAQTINVCVHIRRDKTHKAGRSLSGLDRVVGAADNGRWLLEPLESSGQ